MFCEVQGLAAWDYLSLAFEVLGPRARLAKVLSRLFLGALARADRGAIKQHNEKLADHFQQTQITSDKNQVTNHDYIQLLLRKPAGRLGDVSTLANEVRIGGGVGEGGVLTYSSKNAPLRGK